MNAVHCEALKILSKGLFLHTRPHTYGNDFVVELPEWILTVNWVSRPRGIVGKVALPMNAARGLQIFSSFPSSFDRLWLKVLSPMQACILHSSVSIR